VQIQDRVLPGVNDDARVAMYTSTAGWASVDVRSGFLLGEAWDVVVALENVLDKNYRLHGSGIDQPGRNAFVGVRWRW
jgi:outer membrane receptor protein involved in Fe transport